MIKYNFSPGPAKLNNSVLEIVNKNIIEYKKKGYLFQKSLIGVIALKKFQKQQKRI